METSRTKDIKPFYVMDVLEKAHAMERAGEHVIHLEVGEPDFDTPDPVKEAACKALADGHTHYTHSMGIMELREAICADHAKRYGVSVTPDRVLVTNGTSPAMLLLFSALLEAGDEVILSDPHYACYPNFIRYAQGEPVYVRVREEDGFQYRCADIQAKLTERTRCILINSPANPTGTLLPAERMERIANLGVTVVSDEIYHGLVYGEREHSILEFTDQAFVFNGFSKLYAMTGLRLGYLIFPDGWTRVFNKLSQNFFISANTPAQWAGVAALTKCEKETAMMRAVYDERRKYMLGRLRAMGLGVQVEPTGAFYILADCRHLTDDAYAFAFEVLENAKVGVTPGTDFGPGAQGFIRFSYANSLDNIAEGMDRLERYVKSLEG